MLFRSIESCLICPLRQDRIFCDLPLQELEALQSMSSLATYPKGSILFVEGQESRGVFILCNGRVKLSAGSADGKSLIVRIANGGEIIGLPGTRMSWSREYAWAPKVPTSITTPGNQGLTVPQRGITAPQP